MSQEVRFDSQSLLFESSPFVVDSPPEPVASDYYKHGWTLVSELPTAQAAAEFQAGFIAGIDGARLRLHEHFVDRIKLAKADHIPVCSDVVESRFQVLHFDMGLPLAEGLEQLLVTHVGIYLPATTVHPVTARTRILELGGILTHLELDAATLGERLRDYAESHGDGWHDINTRRLACFARVVDAAAGSRLLSREIDKTVGEWFSPGADVEDAKAYEAELAFFEKFGIDLRHFERTILLEPGQLLILDNLRVVHGRVGQRRERELLNLMYGVERADAKDIALVRSYLSASMSFAGRMPKSPAEADGQAA